MKPNYKYPKTLEFKGDDLIIAYMILDLMRRWNPRFRIWPNTKLRIVATPKKNAITIFEELGLSKIVKSLNILLYFHSTETVNTITKKVLRSLGSI